MIDSYADMPRRWRVGSAEMPYPNSVSVSFRAVNQPTEWQEFDGWGRVPLPAVFEFSDSDSKYPNPWRLVYDANGHGGYGLRELTVTAPNGEPDISGVVLRAVKIGEYAGVAAKILADEPSARVFFSSKPETIAVGRPIPVNRLKDLAGLSDERKQEIRAAGARDEKTRQLVADLVNAAEVWRKPANLLVADYLGLTERTAGRWVQIARDAGNLPPSTRRKFTRKSKETESGNGND